MGFDTMKGRQIAILPSTTTSAAGDSECEYRPHGAQTRIPSARRADSITVGYAILAGTEVSSRRGSVVPVSRSVDSAGPVWDG